MYWTNSRKKIGSYRCWNDHGKRRLDDLMAVEATMPASRPFAIVTGASTGIGTGQALRKKKGYDLLIAADEPEIGQAAASLRGGGTNAEAIQADLATIEGVVFETHGGEPKGGDQDSLTLVVELVRRTDADLFGAGARVDARPAQHGGGCEDFDRQLPHPSMRYSSIS
jgi:NAD(P)-dependent dehydrogenase (short-subunit alcohol dehydrogenase family)